MKSIRTMLSVATMAVLSFVTAGCSSSESSGRADRGGITDGSISDGGLTCRPCLTAGDCTPGGVCVQYGASDYCATLCPMGNECSATEACFSVVADDGTQVSACIPTNGACGAISCGTCTGGATCDVTTGNCVSPEQPDAGSCGTYDPPDKSSCCSSCSPSSGSCQANGCYGGWWCDTSSCKCHSAPSSCGSSPVVDASVPGDAAPLPPPTGTVGPTGGAVSRLYFAVVGDTRPSLSDDTAHYPTAIITQIYSEIEAMSPRPQFVLATGDYQFASPTGSAGAAQLQLYAQARSNYSGVVFGAMGNHECTGYTAGNCSGSTTSNNYQAFVDTLLTPLSQTMPYYSIPINDTSSQWTAKFIVVACNAWDSTQKSWLTTQLATSTTYTFVVRHEPAGAGAPCNSDTDSMLQSATANLLIFGHTHTYYHSGKQLVEGVGGAPITGSANYGFAIVEQQSAGGFLVTQYDYLGPRVVGTFSVP